MTSKFLPLPVCIAIIAMIAVITVSNYLVAIPINHWLTYGAFSFPLVYLVVDLSNRIMGIKESKRIAWISLPFAFLCSWCFADMRIAAASAIAFICAQLLDISLFQQLRNSSWWQAPWISSILSAVLDTALFFSIAFIGTELNWVQLAIGDLAVKWLMASVLLAPYRLLTLRLQTA